jgi:fatty-acyl-CoA synthase
MTFTPVDWVVHHAQVRPNSIALRSLDTGETRSWAALEDRVARLAHGLRHELGLQPGDRLALLSDGDIRVLETQFACIRAGVRFVPLNFRLTPTELIDMCRMVGTTAMISDPVWHHMARQVTEALNQSYPLLWGDPDAAFERLANGGGHLSARPDMRADDVAMILFTSGSTGAPKAASCTLEAMTWQAFNQAEAARTAEAGAHVFTPLPLFHAGGLNSLTNPVLYFGGTATVSARFDPASAARYIGDPGNGVTHIALVPLMYELIAATPEFAAGDYSRLHTAILAGGRLTESLQSTWAAKGVHFAPQYGGTETGPSVTHLPSRMQEQARAGSCGKRVLHVDIRLVDERGADVPTGQAGEIWLRGPAITRGYIGRDPALDFTDGWFRTGDVARVDADGCYFLVDRIKDMYKSGGENVAPAEVEQVLAEHPGVAEVAVIGVAHPKWGEVGLAIVAPNRGAVPTLDQLRTLCDGRLARYKHPYRLELIDRMPRNVTGKIAKDELRTRFGGTLTA